MASALALILGAPSTLWAAPDVMFNFDEDIDDLGFTRYSLIDIALELDRARLRTPAQAAQVSPFGGPRLDWQAWTQRRRQVIEIGGAEGVRVLAADRDLEAELLEAEIGPIAQPAELPDAEAATVSTAIGDFRYFQRGSCFTNDAESTLCSPQSAPPPSEPGAPQAP